VLVDAVLRPGGLAVLVGIVLAAAVMVSLVQRKLINTGDAEVALIGNWRQCTGHKTQLKINA
jgi:hypothetical protein